MKKTQAFLAMGFVITLALAIGFFTQMQEEKGARVRAENMLGSVIRERDAIEVAMNKKLKEKEKLIFYLTSSLSKEKLIISKLTENLERSSRRFVAAGQVKRPIELEKIIVSSLLEAEGKVLAVDKQNDLVVINLGAMDNLKNGDKLSIYRSGSFIANAEIVKVQDKISAAMIIPADSSKDVNVEINDVVK